jgi:two-component system sensor histidine kinase MprB
MTIRRRMTLLAAASVAVAICLAAAISYIAVRAELRGQVDQALRAQAAAVSEFEQRIGTDAALGRLPDRVLVGPDGPGPVGSGSMFIQRIAPGGSTTVPAPFESPIPVADAAERIADAGEGEDLRDTEVAGEASRVITVGLTGGGAIQIARSLEAADDVLANLRVVLLLVILGGCALAALLARRVADRAVAPITGLTEAAERIGATEDLSVRIDEEGEDEVARLAGRFNSMLATLEGSRSELAASVTAQRRLVADASHELRTPVASLRTDIEVLRDNRGLPEAERRRILDSLDDRTAELGALITDVIELARGEAVGAGVSEVRLDLLVAEAVERMRRHAPGRVFKLDLSPSVVEARPDRLARAVTNLLDNAVKFSPAERPIEVRVRSGELAVRDHGPGLAAEEIERVFDRFHRGRAVRETPGSGLGLAIVRQVAEGVGGTAKAANAPGGGALFRICLPPG